MGNHAIDRVRGGLLLLLVAIASNTLAADPSLERAAERLGANQIDSIEYEAAGTYFQFSQAPGPGLPWPAFEVRDYVATLDFARGAVHSRYTRVQKIEAGRVRPAPAEQRMDQYMVNGVAWNVSSAGAPTAIPANLGERTAEIWTTPQGFVKAARDHSATVKRGADGSSEVIFTLGGFRYEGLIDTAGDVLRVRSWMDSPVLGDTSIEWRFHDYRDFDGVRFPSRIERIADELPWYDLAVSRVRVNGAAAFSVPTDIANNPSPSVSKVEVSTLAPGVFYLTGSSHHSVAIEQANGIVVIEAPLNEERSLAVIAKIHELIPRKPITHVINSHVHFDHAGGLRTYANEGVIVVTAEPNVSYFKQAWAAPRTLNPDRLARSKRKPLFQGFTGTFVLEDDNHPVEIHEIVGSGHSDAFSMVWLPAEKIFIQGDAWTPAASGAGAPTNPYWLNLYENIERLNLAVEQIAPLHGDLQTLDDLRIAIGQSRAEANGDSGA